MATAKCYAENGSERGTIDLPDHLFACEVNEPVMHQVVLAYLANQRQGNASTKERADVKGGGKKPWRQKGTGRARAGTIRSPLWRGGGIVFGPHPRSYRQYTPKKVRRLALRSALTSRAQEDAILVIDEPRFTEPKTKRFTEILTSVNSRGVKVLFIIEKPIENVIKSTRNIADLRVVLSNMLTTYDVLWADKIIFTPSSLKVLEEVFK
jgi:large subunit ribosomal protein L4